MFNLDVLQVYSALARHAAESQKVSATNIAHADQPGYRASEIESFQSYLTRTTAAGAAGAAAGGFKVDEAKLPASPNGNTVNLEREVFKSAEAVGQHELAVSVYTKSLDLLRSAIGRRG